LIQIDKHMFYASGRDAENCLEVGKYAQQKYGFSLLKKRFTGPLFSDLSLPFHILASP